MAKKLGVFQTQEQVIQALKQLEHAGFVSAEITVLANHSDHSRRVEAESNFHVDEIQELREVSKGSNGEGRIDLGTGGVSGLGMAGLGFSPMTGGFGLAFSGLPSAIGYGHLFQTNDLRNEEDGPVLQALGLDRSAASLCSQALANGSLVVVVSTDESKSVLDQAGGPDLSRLSEAEAVFRRCGAETITDGG